MESQDKDLERKFTREDQEAEAYNLSKEEAEAEIYQALCNANLRGIELEDIFMITKRALEVSQDVKVSVDKVNLNGLTFEEQIKVIEREF